MIETEETAQNCTRFTSKQLKAIAVLSSIPCEYSRIEEVAKKVGVCRRTLYNWFEDANFNKRVRTEQERSFVRYGSLVRSAHLKGILEDRNPRLIQLFYERVEDWIPRKEAEEDENSKRPVIYLGVPPSPFMNGEIAEAERAKRKKEV